MHGQRCVTSSHMSWTIPIIMGTGDLTETAFLYMFLVPNGLEENVWGLVKGRTARSQNRYMHVAAYCLMLVSRNSSQAIHTFKVPLCSMWHELQHSHKQSLIKNPMYFTKLSATRELFMETPMRGYAGGEILPCFHSISASSLQRGVGVPCGPACTSQACLFSTASKAFKSCNHNMSRISVGY
jgi:hypothetical protein